MNRPKIAFHALLAGGGACFATAGLKILIARIPATPLTILGISLLALAKFRHPPAGAERRTGGLPELPKSARGPLNRFLPTIMELARRAEAVLTAHERFEAEVGGGSPSAFARWALSASRAAAYWLPMSLLAMLAGALAIAPFKLISGGLGLAGTPEGAWLLRQSWPRLVLKIAALGVLEQAYLMGAFSGLEALLQRAGFKKSEASTASAAAVGAAFLACLLFRGVPGMKAAPLLAIQLALLYSYARTRTLVVPAGVNVALGLMSLYSARMIVLLTANLGSIDSFPGIPGLQGVLAVFGSSLGVFAALAANNHWAENKGRFLQAEARAQWERARSLGAWWSRPSANPKSPLALAPTGLLWGIGVYLAGYLTYYAVSWLAPAGETVPAALKQMLLMPFDVLLYVFIIGAALEELIFRYGVFNAMANFLKARDDGLRFWSAALGSAVIFSAFHFIDFSVVVRFFGLNVSRLIQSLMVVYGFSWPGFAGRVAAGVMLAVLYRRSGVLLLPILAHFTSNLLEAVGLRWGLPWFLAAVAAIFALQILERTPPSFRLKAGFALAAASSLLFAALSHGEGLAFDPALVEGEVTRPTDLRAPFLARFDKGDQRLWYVGARHENSRASATMGLIRSVFEKETPRLLIIEGVDNGMNAAEKLRFLAYAKKSCTESSCPAGEPAFAALLADEKKIPFAGGEPSDARVASDVKKLGFTSRDLLAFFFVRQIPQHRREGRLEAAKLPEWYRDCVRNHPILKLEDFPLEAFKRWYREKNGKEFDLSAFDDDEASPKSAGPYYTQKISAAVDLTRNRFVVRLLAESLNARRKVVIVYGASHFFMGQRALEEQLGKPVISGFHEASTRPVIPKLGARQIGE